MTAAAARKLQKEIDNVLKKVDDGISEFADYWEQATAAGSNQQKEKLGEELKKSINKLQRFRVQIREWLAQSGVQSNCKDKLEDARKRVENDMQRFKDFERELKTKAFSTCALARGDELELEEAEKVKYQEWLSQTIQALNDQLDQFEADLEVLANKRSLNADDKAGQAQLKTLQERHRWHIQKLELCLRAVDNDALDLSDLAVVRDSVDYYVESNQEESCYHDEGMYDCFDLTEFEDKVVTTPKSPSQGPKEAPGSGNAKEDASRKTKEKDKRRKDEKKDKKKEERDKKGAGTPQNAATSGPAKGAGTRVGDTKAGQPTSAGDVAHGAQGESREQTELDEIKVQEDQLLSEAAEFICKICQIHVAGCGPKLTSCSHLFCGDCIAQWFNQHPESQTWAQRARSAGPDRVVPCPVCKQPLNEKRDLYPVCGVTSRSENLLLWRMLSSLKIMCANHPKVRPDGKCEWVGEYGSYQKHASMCKNQSTGEGGSASTAASDAQNRPHALSVDSESDICSTPVSRQASCKSTPSLSATPQAQDVTEAAHAAATSATASLGTSPAPVSFTLDIQESDVPVSKSPKAASAVASAATPPGTPLGGASVAAAATAANGDSSSGPQRRSGANAPEARSSDQSYTVRAVSSFEPTGSNMSLVQSGDLIQVLEQHATGWTYAKNLSSASSGSCGWIPSWLVPQPASQPQTTEAQPVRAATAQPTPSLAPMPAAAAPAAEARPVLRACSTFAAASPSQLTLTPSDYVEVVERHASGWTYGRKVTDVHAEGPVEGWFPDWVVAQK